MAEHLSALDATFLELEQDDPSAHMHIGGLLIFEPRPDGSIPSVEELTAHLDSRLGELPRYHQRLSDTRVHGLRFPTWELDVDLDLREHVSRAALPTPGGRAELLAWVSDYWSHRLDRTRPLWDVVLLEGLEGGRWALVNRTHHCMVDGVGSMDVGYAVLDTTPEPQDRMPYAPPAPEPHRGRASSLAHALDPRGLPDLVSRSRAMADVLVRDELIAAPTTSLNDAIGTLRRIETVRFELDELKAVKNRLGGTVNDVVLAACAGALRALFLYRGEVPPRRGMRAMVPMNIRDAAERLGLGNRVTSLFAQLPVAEADPLRRYAVVTEETTRLKGGHEALGAKTILDVTSMAPPLLHAALARTLYASRLFNVTITNVPGPPMTLYGLGSELRDIYGLVPIFTDHALGVCIVSYGGGITFTVSADRTSVPDLDVFRTGLEESMDELRALAAGAIPVAW
jgi:diacylglycerol O-acyltransferase / wax synthase